LSFGITFLYPNLESTHAKSFCGRLHGGDLLAEGTTGKHQASTVYKFTYSRSHQVDGPQQDSDILLLESTFPFGMGICTQIIYVLSIILYVRSLRKRI